jgi:hypothetical protein
VAALDTIQAHPELVGQAVAVLVLLVELELAELRIQVAVLVEVVKVVEAVLAVQA